MFDPHLIRANFPFLQGSGVAWLDNASTTQKPQAVLDAMNRYYTEYCSNVHRGLYKASEAADAAFETVREQVRQFLNAASVEEIIFTSGATHSLNLAARLVGQTIQAEDEVVVTELEHHSNLVPWQLVTRERGANIVLLPLTENETLDPADFEKLITPRTKVLAVTHMSNVTGYVAPIKALIDIAHQHGITVVVDAAQSAAHGLVDVQALDADLLAFSGHKLLGPTGIGVLYGKKTLLEHYEPVYGGGMMIDTVTPQSSTWATLPTKFEPGTPNVAGVIGLGAALTYLQEIGWSVIEQHIQTLTMTLRQQLLTVPGLRIMGPTTDCTSVVSFVIDGLHPHDIAAILDQHAVAVRSGHHCAQPLHRRWGVPATTRASLYLYNTEADIEQLITGLLDARKVLLG
jgi:cysteine desulfurase/selenocysteine lyase